MYNLGHLGLYKNIPKKRMFNSTPDYERDSYSLLQYKSHLRNEFLIPLKADGDGTGVATIRLQSTEDQAINITGAGRFYTNEQGTTGESTSAVVGTSLTPLYVKLSAGSCYLVLTKADKLSGLVSSLVIVINAPIIDGCNIGYKLHSVTTIRSQGNTKSFFTGSIDNCPSLIGLNINSNPLSKFTGSIDSCSSLAYFDTGGNSLSNVSGDIGKVILCNYFNCNGNTSPLTYVTRRSNWTSALRRIHISSASMTTEMVDNLFMDIDSSGVPAANEKLINVSGLCAPVSDASAAARASLVSKGFTIVVNT